MNTTELVTATELAKWLQVTPETVRLWSRRGRIPRVALSRKVIRYNVDAVMRALAPNAADKGGHDEA